MVKKTTKKSAKKTKASTAKAKTAKKRVKKSATKKSVKPTKRPAKKAAKKTVREVPAEVFAPPQKSRLPILLIAIAALVIIIGAAMLFGGSNEPKVAAVVNGEEITMADLEKQYNVLPEQYKELFTKTRVLNQLVDETLVVQFGAEKGIIITPEEVNEEVQSLFQDGLTQEQLEENLAGFNLTIDDFEGLIERKLMIEKTMSAILAAIPPPSEQNVRDYYDNNIETFKVAEQVTARHILVASQREDSAQLGKELLDRVQAGEDFCDLVNEYTDDVASKGNCGEYTFGKGRMVPEFEKASFDMSPGDVTMVTTQFGHHIIEKIADVPASEQSFEEVKGTIASALYQEGQTVYYQQWLEGQKQSSEIVIYYEE